MKLYIDADACPVIDIAITKAREANIECILICDTSHYIERNDAKVIVVSKGADSADFRLVNMLQENDIVITQDYGLAAMCLARRAKVINQNGIVFNDENILLLLNNRYDSAKQRRSGKHTKGPPKRVSEDDKAFMREFEKLILL